MTQKMYNNKEDFERKNPYVIINLSEYEPAHIMESCSNKKVAENKRERIGGGLVMTRKQADKAISEWNKKQGW